MHHYPVKVLVVHGIVRAKSGGIIVIDDTVVGMGRIVHAGVALHTEAMKNPPCAQQESQCVRRLKERIARKGGLGNK